MNHDPNSYHLVDALYDVLDPETGLNLVDMGLIYDVSFQPEDGEVKVVMTLTTPACPAGGVMHEGVQRRLMAIPGVRHVEVELSFEPRWSVDRISEEGKRQLGW